MSLDGASVAFAAGAPAFVRGAGGRVPLATVVSDDFDEATATARVAVLPQRGRFTYTASVAGEFQQSVNGPPAGAKPHGTLHLALRTPTVYEDSRYVVVHLWTSAPGFGRRANPSNVKVKLENSANGKENEGGCTITSAGGNTCSVRVDSGWFSIASAGSVTVTATMDGPDGGTTTSEESGTMALTQVPSSTGLPPSGTGMWLWLPTYPLVPGATFTTKVRAHTGAGAGASGAFALSTWLVQVPMHASMSFVSVASSKYDVSKNVDGATLKLTATRKSAFAKNPAGLTGTDLEVATITFKVSAGAPNGSIASALTLFVDDMVSSAGVKKIDDSDGLLFSAAGVGTAGTIVVEAAFDVALQAYVSDAHEQELVNLAMLGASTLASASPVPIVVRAVRSCHTRGGTGCSEGGSAPTAVAPSTCR